MRLFHGETGNSRDKEMQAVILAGGLGTRLRPLTAKRPKAMVSIAGRPFLEYQIGLLRDAGIDDIVLCVGYLAEQIIDYFGDGSSFGVRLRYSVERERLLGTAGAVKQAEPLLTDIFFLTYGDSYLRLDYRAVWDYFQRSHKLGLMVVYRNENRFDRSNVVVADGLVKVYDKERTLPGMDYINFGVSLLRKEALSLVPSGIPYSQEEWYAQLIERGELLAYEVRERFYEIGSPRGLEEFRRLVAAGVLP
jgi:NDP-sugar pyrophosphorylase family protein